MPPPPLIDEPIKHSRKAAQGGRGWPVRPRLTGTRPSAVEWQGAVRVRAGDAGSMAGPEGPVLEALLGADGGVLWFCLRFKDAVPEATLTVDVALGNRTRTLTVRLPEGACRTGRGEGHAEAAVGDVVTVRWTHPFAAGERGDGASVQVSLHVELENGVVQQLPPSGTMTLALPPESDRWRAAWA